TAPIPRSRLSSRGVSRRGAPGHSTSPRRCALLELIDVGTQSIDAYAASAGAEVVEELRALAEPLRGVRVLHLNATPYGGGVAEILRSKIPLLRDLGLAADWRIICGDEAFFTVTKKIHNGLQGAP